MTLPAGISDAEPRSQIVDTSAGGWHRPVCVRPQFDINARSSDMRQVQAVETIVVQRRNTVASASRVEHNIVVKPTVVRNHWQSDAELNQTFERSPARDQAGVGVRGVAGRSRERRESRTPHRAGHLAAN